MVKKILAKGYVYLVLLFLYAPIAVLVIYSFTPAATMQWQGFSFELYRTRLAKKFQKENFLPDLGRKFLEFCEMEGLIEQ